MNVSVFEKTAGSRLAGTRKPRYWPEWNAWQRTRWLREGGFAADAIEAMEILQRMGDWPEIGEEETTAQIREMQRKKQHHNVPERPRGPQKKGKARVWEGRRDRLADYY